MIKNPGPPDKDAPGISFYRLTGLLEFGFYDMLANAHIEISAPLTTLLVVRPLQIEYHRCTTLIATGGATPVCCRRIRPLACS
jgi:hypothetical protein